MLFEYSSLTPKQASRFFFFFFFFFWGGAVGRLCCVSTLDLHKDLPRLAEEERGGGGGGMAYIPLSKLAQNPHPQVID